MTTPITQGRAPISNLLTSRNDCAFVIEMLVAIVLFALLGSSHTQSLVRSFYESPSHTWGHLRELISIHTVPDYGMVFSGAHDQKIKVWNSSTGAFIRNLNTDSSQYGSPASHLNNFLFTTGGLHVWNLDTMQRVETLSYSASHLTPHPSSNSMLIGQSNGNVVQLSYPAKTVVRSYTGRHTGAIRGIVAIGSSMFTASEDGTVRQWNMADGNYVKILTPGHTTGGHVQQLIPYGADKLLSSAEAEIRIWSSSGTLIKTMNVGGSWFIRALIIDDTLIPTSFNGIRRINLVTAQESVVLNPIDTRGLSVDATRFFTGSVNGILRAWDSFTFQTLWETIPNGEMTAAVCDGEHLWVNRGNEIQQYTIPGATLVRKLSRHTSMISQLVLAGIFLFSSSNDQTINQWNSATGAYVRTYTGHTSVVTDIGIVYRYDRFCTFAKS